MLDGDAAIIAVVAAAAAATAARLRSRRFRRCSRIPVPRTLDRLQICGIFTEELLKNSALLDLFARTECSTRGGGWVVGELRISL